jgi:hypothetical protein
VSFFERASCAELTMVLCFFTASPVLAEEVLYCVDTAVAGFKWDKSGQASVAEFKPGRFTIKIVSVTERIVTPMEGDIAGRSRPIACSGPSPFGETACDDEDYGRPWLFYRNTYTRAFLSGPPAGGDDPNIWIAYGICTKF